MANTDSNPNHSELAKILFSPPNGRTYQPGDFERVCRFSPLAFGDLPLYLWEEDLIPGLTPPRLWYGWHVGEKGLLDIMQRHYPSRVLYNRYQEVRLMASLMHLLPRIICEEFQLPAEYHHLVKVRDAARSDGEVDMILSIGCTYKGTVPLDGDFVERLKRELFNGEDPKWVLCAMKWGWSTKKRVSNNAKTTKNTARRCAAPPVVATLA